VLGRERERRQDLKADNKKGQQEITKDNKKETTRRTTIPGQQFYRTAIQTTIPRLTRT
jgi:hypothetical protein